ncbi:membrane or secreted protein [Spongiimicrobium salis]|uniref:membrane or secreted protein n=1 Tax=Spongiimicrobium salis TaxID=1667022 RepID=UPI00374DFA84
MKKILCLLICSIFVLAVKGQGFIGAWEGYHTSEEGVKLKSVVIFSEKHQVISTYEAETGKFVSSNGGTWKLEGDMMTEKVEFDTKNAERVGSEIQFKVYNKDSIMGIVGHEMTLKRIDKGLPGKLQGAWLMSGRIRDGKTQSRDVNRPRKTMKILSGTRFQWIAYNTETKQFMGTGGGTYTTVDGTYTEQIEFFSRDDSRVGAKLNFNYELIDGKWHHSGLSSKGNPIHEIWSVRE